MWGDKLINRVRNPRKDYKKHSVLELEEFVGWDLLISMIQSTPSKFYQALAATLFSTGARISEGLQLTPAHFTVGKEVIVVTRMPVVKQKLTYNKWRTFDFPKVELTWKYVEQHLDKFSNRTKNRLLFPIRRETAWRNMKKMGGRVGLEVWNHWFRSMRASQMGAEYDFTENELLEWFKTKDRDWARRYSKKGHTTLGRKMVGIAERVFS